MVVLEGIKPPPPVFFCSIEPESLSAQKSLDEALNLLQKEDPSFSVTQDPDSGQTLLSAMGELHLEILKYVSYSSASLSCMTVSPEIVFSTTIGWPPRLVRSECHIDQQ